MSALNLLTLPQRKRSQVEKRVTMDIAFYFSPPDFEEDSLLDGHLGKKVVFSNGKNIDDWDESLGFVILGVNEDRGAINNEGCAYAPDIIRKHLYRLYSLPISKFQF
jgi:formiminoglutamase